MKYVRVFGYVVLISHGIVTKPINKLLISIQVREKLFGENHMESHLSIKWGSTSMVKNLVIL